MNRLEFSIAMKEAEMYKIINPNGTYFNELTIRMSDSYYAIVEGKIPLEVAQIIYEKYPENEYKIRVEGGCNGWNPTSWAVDEKYEEAMNKPYDNLNSIEVNKRYEKERKKLIKRSDENKYIKTYHIDTKEGLIVFLTEMKDYYLRKNNQKETEAEKFDKILAKTTENLIKEINPTITAYEWMQSDPENKRKYNAKSNNPINIRLKNKFRDALKDFDKAVNPFIDKELILDSPLNYTKKVKINGYVSDYDYYNLKERKNCCHMTITDKNRECASTDYYRTSNGFSFMLNYNLSETKYLCVAHYYTTKGNHKSDIGEVISIYAIDTENEENRVDLRLNISNWKAGKTYYDKTPATVEQLVYVYEKLIDATEYAKTITVDNMTKQNVKEKDQ